MTTKTLHSVTGGILSCFMALHYLEEVKNTNFFSGALKNLLNRVIKELIIVEKKYYDKIDVIDGEETADKLMCNKLTVIKEMQRDHDYARLSDLEQVVCAYRLDPKALMRVTDKIHFNNSAVKIG